MNQVTQKTCKSRLVLTTSLQTVKLCRLRLLHNFVTHINQPANHKGTPIQPLQTWFEVEEEILALTNYNSIHVIKCTTINHFILYLGYTSKVTFQHDSVQIHPAIYPNFPLNNKSYKNRCWLKCLTDGLLKMNFLTLPGPFIFVYYHNKCQWSRYILITFTKQWKMFDEHIK